MPPGCWCFCFRQAVTYAEPEPEPEALAEAEALAEPKSYAEALGKLYEQIYSRAIFWEQ